MTTTSTSPARPPQADATRIAQALFGRALADAGSRWRLPFDFVRPACARAEQEVASLDDFDAKLRSFGRLNSCDPGWTLQLGRHLWRTRLYVPPGAPPERLMTALAADADPARLFMRGGAFYEPKVLDPYGRPVVDLIAPARLRRAVDLCWEQIRAFRPAPSVVAHVEGRFRLFWLLSRPVLDGTPEYEDVIQLQFRFADLLHGGIIVDLRWSMRAELVREDDGASAFKVRALQARSDLVYDFEYLADAARRLAAVHEAPHILDNGVRRTKPPLAMRLRSLMDGWNLEDLDLSPEIANLLVSDETGAARVSLDPRVEIIRALAYAGFGAEDAVMVVSDPRFAPGRALAMNAILEARVKLVVRAALKEAAWARPVRLPYGICSITPLGRPEDGGPPRYVVRGGTKASPFELEVDYGRLTSSRKFQRALGEHLGRPVYPVLPEVWAGLLQSAFADPRVLRPLQTPGQGAPPSIAAIVAAIVAKAVPWTSFPVLGDGGLEPEWPVVKDGLVYIRLRALTAAVAREIEGPAPSLGEVTRAARTLGGGPAGCVRFGKARFQVWSLPLRGLPAPPSP